MLDGRRHRVSPYSMLAASTAEREAEWKARTTSPAEFIQLPSYRNAAWSASSKKAQVVEATPKGPDGVGPDAYSAWKCPGKLDAMCFNYYDEETGTSDGNDPGSDLSVFKINYKKKNRTNLLPPGCKARKDSKKVFNC